MNGELKILILYKSTLWDMALKQLKAKYTASFFGIFWAAINPILIMFAITFVFTVVFKIEIKNFHLFVLSGIYPWIFFSSSVSQAASTILGQQTILRQFNLPRQILPLSNCLAGFLNFLIGWLVIYPIFLIFNPAILLYIPLFLFIILLNFLFICGICLSLSVLNIFFRDIEHILGTVLMFWLWVTPVFYPVEMVPLSLRWVCYLNPLTPFTLFYSDILYKAALPAAATILAVIFWSVLSVITGWLIFGRLEGKILKRI